MNVKDYMNKCVITALPDTPLRKINQLMHRYHVQSVVIVSEDGHLEGIVTYNDLFRALLPSYDEVMQDESLPLNPERIENRVIDLVKQPVKNYMTKKVETVQPEMPIVLAGALMNAHRVKQFPVLENNKLVGSISFTDITWGLLFKQI